MFKLTHIKEKSIGRLFGIGKSDTAGAATAAAVASNASAQDMINFLKEQQSVSKPIQDRALQDYAAMINNPGQALSGIKSGGLYGELLASQDEAVLRGQSAAGRLRGGGTLSALGNVQNQALLNAYNQKLQGLGNLTDMGGNYTQQIAGGIGQIGVNTAQGIIGEAQNKQNYRQSGFNNLTGLIGLGASMFSDERLKSNITKTGEKGGFNIYQWDWNDKAKELGLSGEGVGVLASEVEKINPAAVTMRDGYKMVNYEMIGVLNG